MYAYIKFLDGPVQGNKYRAPANKIDFSFTDATFDENKKYFAYHKDDTEKELDHLINANKRQRIVPVNKLDTASEKSDANDGKNCISNPSTPSRKEMYDKLMSIKIEKLDMSKTKPKDVTLDNEKNLASFGKIIGIKPDDLENIVNGSSQLNRGQELHINNFNSEEEKAKSSLKYKERVITDNSLDDENISNNSNQTDDKVDVDGDNKKAENEKALQNKENINRLKVKVYTKLEGDNKIKYVNVNKELNQAKKDLAKVKKENIKLEKKIECLKQKCQEATTEAEKYRLLNVHIGRNQWLDEKVYNNVNNKSKNPKQFVGNVLVAVFGSEILQKSTITGRASNKMNSKEKFNQLDPTVAAACKDAYAHWLETLYAKIFPDYHHELEFANFNEYASKKISYLKRPPKEVTKQRNKTSEEEQTESTSKRQKMNVTPDQTNNSENYIENEDKADENAEEGELNQIR
ncbi:pentatricopeptide repeat-containing protein PFL1605w-like [Camponotus floridanus]|uniref:pentatricopeptide repeat-containing protein PFL1605w-like n=1 Tax=Camponotus floridanus TaxID=104421 RepID=UPI000DC68988|nr:pentatricopeptide repeat-containing protein PFL1605w-like [Camponotus floridanus]